MIKEAIIKLSQKEDLTYQEAESVMDEIMSGQATPVQMSSYLTALSMKGETIDEITASAAGMRAHCIKLLHDLLMDLARIGLGIACIPDYMLNPDDSLKPIPLADPLPPRQLVLVQHDSLPLSQAAERFLDMFS